jgi:excisionase family DNA binding protein
MELWDVKQAAVYLGLSEQRVRQFCGQGRFGTKVGNQWIIDKADLERFAQLPRPSGRPPETREGEG